MVFVMSEIRKYVALLEFEENQLLEASKRKEAIKALNNYSYLISLHIAKCIYLPDYSSYDHWLHEIVAFTNNATKKAQKISLSYDVIFEEISRDVLSLDMRNKMVFTIHDEYDFVAIDLDDLYQSLHQSLKLISKNIASGNKLSYNTIKSIIEDL